jgi:phage terminase small subunit
MSETEIPEELGFIQGDKALPAFHRLNLKQQKFLLHYIREGNGAEAYRQSYNELAEDNVAATCASRLLTNVDIKAVLEAFQDHKDEDLILIRRTYVDAAKGAIKPIYGKDSNGQPEKVEDLPDHDVRIKAAQSLAKLHGLNAAEKQEITGADGVPLTFAVTVNYVKPPDGSAG